jgi:hypothetical protein
LQAHQRFVIALRALLDEASCVRAAAWACRSATLAGPDTAEHIVRKLHTPHVEPLLDAPLVSGIVKDLTAGAGRDFETRGTHVLKGVPGEWLLHRVITG